MASEPSLLFAASGIFKMSGLVEITGAQNKSRAYPSKSVRDYTELCESVFFGSEGRRSNHRMIKDKSGNPKSLYDEVNLVRSKGLNKIPILLPDLPRLKGLAQNLDPSLSNDYPAAIEEVLRAAIEQLGEEGYGAAASALLGFATGAREMGTGERQEYAAECLLPPRKINSFRAHDQKPLLESICYALENVSNTRSASEPQVSQELDSRSDTIASPNAIKLTRNRKLLIFVLTIGNEPADFKDFCLETIVRSGHIPMSVFQSPGKEISDWNGIQSRVEQCDYCFVILGQGFNQSTPDQIECFEREYELVTSCRIPISVLTFIDSQYGHAVTTPAESARESSGPNHPTFDLQKIASLSTENIANLGELGSKVRHAIETAEQRLDVRRWVRDESRSTFLALPSLESRVLVAATGTDAELEGNHNFYQIEKYLRTNAGSKELLIGSPYLRYWLESQDPRLDRILQRNPDLRAEVVLFERTEDVQPETTTERQRFSDRLDMIQAEHGDRVTSHVTVTKTDLSYVTYTFRQDPDSPLLRRLLVGLQFLPYVQRPFIELVTVDSEPDEVTAGILAFHRREILRK